MEHSTNDNMTEQNNEETKPNKISKKRSTPNKNKSLTKDDLLKKSKNDLLKNIKDNEKLSDAEKNWALQLVNSHQIILTGAPGTGKTFAAEKIATVLTGEKEITGKEGCRIERVQFHPSMDYTDFMEGLRPIKDKNGNISFERQDGIFKAFCSNAVNSLDDYLKPTPLQKLETQIKEKFSSFIENKKEDSLRLVNKQKDKIVYLNLEKSEDKEGRILITKYYKKEENDDKQDSDGVKQNNKEEIEGIIDIKTDTVINVFSKYYIQNKFYNQNEAKVLGQNIRNELSELYGTASYIAPICVAFYNSLDTEIKTNIQNYSCNNDGGTQKVLDNYVFIIDEINRGDIAKIFGELFFAIDPSYRGKKGMVKTQYQNLVKDDPYGNGFYIPENVYIIGTMNDIDRGVESMDFAIRRRFTWIEVDPTDTADSMLNSLNDQIKKSKEKKEFTGNIKEKMTALNDVIKNITSLGDAYQIGGAYFLKLKELKELKDKGGLEDGQDEFDALWEYHLEPLLKEYLRGEQNVKTEIGNMKTAYQNADTYVAELEKNKRKKIPYDEFLKNFKQTIKDQKKLSTGNDTPPVNETADR